jgi:hypothetical protein
MGRRKETRRSGGAVQCKNQADPNVSDAKNYDNNQYGTLTAGDKDLIVKAT